MRHRVFAIVIIAACGLASPARALEASASVSIDYRSNELNFRLPFNSPLPGGSELIWQNLAGPFTSVAVDYPLSTEWSASFGLGYGEFSSGRVTDRDWLDASGTFSFTEHDADEGGVTDASLKLARRFDFFGIDGDLSIGYAYNQLDMHALEKGSIDVFPGGRTFRGLDTTYDARAHLFTLAFDRPVRYAVNGFRFGGGTEIGAGYYYAEANWNLRSDFAHPLSFAHYGTPVSLAVRIEPSFGWGSGHEIGLRARSSVYTVIDPSEELFFSSGRTIDAPLDEISSTSFSAGIFYRRFF